MSIDLENSNKPLEPSGSLDELLARARWKEVDPGAVERLERSWGELFEGSNVVRNAPPRVAAKRLRIRLRWWTAIAAGICLAAYWGFASSTPSALPADATQTQIASKRTFSPSINRDAPLTESADEPRPQPFDPNLAFPSRPASAYDQVAIRAATRQAKIAARQKADPLAIVIAEIVANEQADVPLLCQPLLADREIHEARLLQSIGAMPAKTQQAAIWALGPLGSRRSFTLLLLAARRPATSEAAIEALGQLASSSELAEMATGEPSLRLRTRLLAVVLERGDPASLSVFLRCVALRATRAAALAAVESIESIERLPMEALFDNLCQDHPAERLAAARVLGKINDEKTTDRLIGMAVDGVCYEGALAALTTSDAPEASRFLRRAQRDARFLNAVQSARFQMQTL